MSTLTRDREQLAIDGEVTPTVASRTRLFAAIAIASILVGAGSMLGGIGGAVYTWDQAVDQNITTPDDAVLAEVPVRGPLSMWSQSDIITTHQLDRTGGLYYSEMEREIQATDEAGEPVFDEAGEPVMVPNEARNSWVSATSLTTSLGLGILAYALSAFAFVVGGLLVAMGFGFLRLRTL